MNIVASPKLIKLSRRLPQPVQEQLAQLLRTIAAAQTFADILHLKSIEGHRNYYRARLGNYRVGLFWTGDGFIAQYIEPRGDFYKNYP